MSEPRPRGSGKFSFAAGLVFLAVFVASIVINLREICPYKLLQGWPSLLQRSYLLGVGIASSAVATTIPSARIRLILSLVW